MHYREQQEANARREAERTIKSLRKDVDDATLARMDLERRVETLQEELELLRATTNEVSFYINIAQSQIYQYGMIQRFCVTLFHGQSCRCPATGYIK